MEYENPEIPEGINNSDRRPVLNFLRLAAAAAALFAVAGGLLVVLADRLMPLLPFRYEVAVTRELFPAPGGAGPIEPYLQELTARLARVQQLPEDMAVTVHYDEGPAVNAFATLGGHIVVYRGLLQAMPDENALAMVLAHEIAHVRERHPIATTGRSVALGLLLTLLDADEGSKQVQAALSRGGVLTMLSFSRAQEEAADAAALAAVHGIYGHVGGADSFFRQMLGRAEARQPPRFLSSHPLTAERIEALAALAQRNRWPSEGPRTRIPAAVRAELERQRASKLAPDAQAPLQLAR